MLRITSRGGRRLLWIAATFLIVSFATRIGLAIFSAEAYSGAEWARFIGVGFIFDLLVAPSFLLPWAIYDAIVPEFKKHPRLRRIEALWATAWAGAFLTLFLVVAAAEFAFWGEFASRFDFIAVDYLVYTHEVIGNIRESYPVPLGLSIIFALSLTVCWLTWPRAKSTAPSRWSLRAVRAVIAGLAVWGGVTALNVKLAETDSNVHVEQLSMNGVFAFAHAFRHNELDYDKYYPKLAKDDLDREIRKLVQERNAVFFHANGVDRRVSATLPRRNANVILISVESLSAEFLGHFGDEQNLTPVLDDLAEKSLFFTRFYATGTRTVRGLEALSVGTPPTPGQSIVRRPKSDNLENLGEELAEYGWEPYWIYGGYGMFDNMNTYFASNHYNVVDRSDLSSEGIGVHHENIWGIADEDLYSLSLAKFDKVYERGKPFFAHIMTTSNHRPYTFPENRVDMPQKHREGAVKYTDWAIGDFIRRAKDKPWFDNTLFIITGDHTAKAAGKTDLPPARYHIPMIWYAPKMIQPEKMTRLMSQMDLPPTLLDWLGVSYESRFLGYDMFTLEPGRERAFISTYQKLGYMKGDKLVVLDVNRRPSVTKGLKDAGSADSLADEDMIHEAIAWYQYASEAFSDNRLKDVE